MYAAYHHVLVWQHQPWPEVWNLKPSWFVSACLPHCCNHHLQHLYAFRFSISEITISIINTSAGHAEFVAPADEALPCGIICAMKSPALLCDGDGVPASEPEEETTPRGDDAVVLADEQPEEPPFFFVLLNCNLESGSESSTSLTAERGEGRINDLGAMLMSMCRRRREYHLGYQSITPKADEPMTFT